jgi:hypothetical protein
MFLGRVAPRNIIELTFLGQPRNITPYAPRGFPRNISLIFLGQPMNITNEHFICLIGWEPPKPAYKKCSIHITIQYHIS